jgi:hypothetical protein
MSVTVAGQPISIAVVVGTLVLSAILLGLWVGLKRARVDDRAQVTAWLSVAIPLVVWLLIVLQLAQAGVFRPRPGAGVAALPLAIALPIVIGLLLLTRSTAVGAAIDAVPLSWLVGIQVYRVLGADFLVQWAAGRLPAAFAIPAGTGDVLVGLLALPVALYVRSGARGGHVAAYAWNLLGLADLAVAVGTGFLTTPGRFQVLALDHPNTLLGAYPLVMVPAFMVPLSIILHGLSLWQLARAGRSGRVPDLQPTPAQHHDLPRRRKVG